MAIISVFINLVFAFQPLQLKEIETKINELNHQYLSPTEFKSRRERIFQLSEAQCTTELLQIFKKNNGTKERCQERLWRIHFNFHHKSDIAQLKNELDDFIKQIDFDHLSSKERDDLHTSIKSLQTKWAVFEQEREP